jgi:glycosyltransferase involved in cell wall biosynthesis
MTALNEEGNIGKAIESTLKAFDYYNLNGEIIVVNDGSNDKTKEVVENIISEKNNIKLLNHDSPKGVGASFWEGVDVSRAEFVTWLPGDDQNDPYETLRYFRLLDDVDIVIPFVYNKEVRPIVRNFLSFVFRFIVNNTFNTNFNYTNGSNLYRRTTLLQLDYRSNGFFFQVDILIRLIKEGYLFAEVPFKLMERQKGESKAVSFPSFINVVKGYLHLVRDYYLKKNISQGNALDGKSKTSYRKR